VACGECREEKNRTGTWWGKLKRSDNLKDVGVDGTIILKLILNKYDERAWTGLIWLRKGISVGLL